MSEQSGMEKAAQAEEDRVGATWPDTDGSCKCMSEGFVAGALHLLKIAEEWCAWSIDKPKSINHIGSAEELLEHLKNYCGKGRGE